MAGISSGQILRLREMLQLRKSLDGKSIRTWGRAVFHDIGKSQLKICEDGLEVFIDTSLVEPMAFNKGSMYQFIGELHCSERLTLRARIACCIDGVNMELFNQAVDVRRKYLNEQIIPCTSTETVQ